MVTSLLLFRHDLYRSVYGHGIYDKFFADLNIKNLPALREISVEECFWTTDESVFVIQSMTLSLCTVKCLEQAGNVEKSMDTTSGNTTEVRYYPHRQEWATLATKIEEVEALRDQD
jgi:hypothetical protein